MRTPWCLLTTMALLGSACNRISFPDGGWDGRSATFKWWAGSVRLPPGFTYRPSQGGDSFEGRFTSPDRKLVVDHDIGACYISGRTHRERNPAHLMRGLLTAPECGLPRKTNHSRTVATHFVSQSRSLMARAPIFSYILPSPKRPRPSTS